MTNMSYAATYLFEKTADLDKTRLLQIQTNLEDILFDYSRRSEKDGVVKTLLLNDAICDASGKDGNVCTACTSSCESSAIFFDTVSKHISISFAHCSDCQKCVSVCPSGALEDSAYNKDAIVAALEACDGANVLIATESELATYTATIPSNTVIFCVSNHAFLNEMYLSLFAFKTGGAVYFVSKDALPVHLQQNIQNTNEIFKTFGKQAILFLSDIQDAKKSFEPIEKRFENSSLRVALSEGFKSLGDFGGTNFVGSKVFSSLKVDSSCTLCMGCAYVCKSGAFYADESQKALTLNESLCTGCGYCESICPEKSIAISQGVFKSEKSYFEFGVVAKDEIFCCVECGKPFATSKAIGKVAAAMSALFLDEDKKRTLYCCADCKPKIMLKEFAERSLSDAAR